jgi:hypothetical protein
MCQVKRGTRAPRTCGNGAIDTTSRPPGRVWRLSPESKNSLQSSHDRVYAPYAPSGLDLFVSGSSPV